MQHRELEGLIHGMQDSMFLKEREVFWWELTVKVSMVLKESHPALEAKTHKKKSHNVPEANLSRNAGGRYELQTQQ
ncbi:hypothetical protein NL676_003638 [Syzygium grande]|nr:hypothetical protein NL676_003638 [Syzygium grande]